jgi:hypothetical protein
VQPIKEAMNVCTGAAPKFEPPRASGSSVIISWSPTIISALEWLGQVADNFILTVSWPVFVLDKLYNSIFGKNIHY